jgi:ABC-type glycerol-3-phosphate transport system substrate-binding protein
MRRLFAPVAALLLIMLLMTGCTSSNTGGSGSSDGNGKQTITIMSLDDASTQKALQSLANDYEKAHPKVKIKFQLYPFNNLFQQQQVTMNAHDSGTDIIYGDGPNVTNFAFSGYLEPLDPYFSKDDINQWTPAMISEVTVNNKLMAAPMNSSSQLLFYNKDIFKQKGITPPSENSNERWTWEQVVDAGKKLTYTENNKQVWGFVFEQINRAYQLIPLAQSLGAEQLVSKDGLTSNKYTNSPQMIQAAQFYSDLFNKWKVSPKITNDQTGQYFQAGKVAMFEGGPWNIPALQKAGLNFGFAPVPYFKDGKPVTPTGSWTFAVSKFSNN